MSLTAPFELLQRLGSGSTGEVWRARALPGGALPEDRELALKRLAPELVDDATARAAFESEYEAAAGPQVAGLVRALGRGEHEGRPWIAMELVPGETLAEVLAREGRLPEDEVRAHGARLAAALAALHERGWLHGDVKPANVRLDEHERAVLLDLGFARRLGRPSERRPGTLAYLAPEQLAGAPGDSPAEVFALGVVLYELATGTHPFLAADARADDAAAVSALREARLEPPSERVPALSPFLDHLLAAMLAPDPRRRPRVGRLRRILSAGERSAWWRRSSAPEERATADLLSRHSTRVIGRERELERLARLWRSRHASGTRPAAVSVTLRAPTGGGKSRLVQELALRLRRRDDPPLFLAAHTPLHAERRPCQPFVRLLRRWLGLPSSRAPGPREQALLEQLVPPASAAALSAALDPAFEGSLPSAVPAALATWLAALAARAPLLVFLDDFDRADAASIEVLSLAVEAASAAPWMLVVGERTTEARAHPPAAERLELRLAESTRHSVLELPPLDEAAVLAIVEELFHPSAPRERLARVLWRHSRGSPAFLVETMRALVERGEAREHPDGKGLVLDIAPDELVLPASLTRAVAESLARLPAAEREWLERLAVVGDRVTPALLARVWPERPDEPRAERLGRLVEGGWLEDDGERLRFARPSLREVVLRRVAPIRRRALHGLVADALRPPPGGRIALADAFQRAWHLRAAGRRSELLRVLLPLLGRLLERGQPQRVHLLCTWALETLDELPPGEARDRRVIEFLESAADAADRSGLRAEQRSWLDRLSETGVDPERDPAAAGRVYLLHARYSIAVGRYGPARAMLRNAILLFEEAGEAALLSEALRRMAGIQGHVGELEEARELARRALKLAPDGLLRSQAELALGVVELLEDRLERALTHADRAIRALRGLPSQRATATVAQANLLRARALRSGGRPRRALASAQRALRLARLAGERRLEAEAGARLGGHLLDIDRPAEAQTRLREALRLSIEIEDRRGEALARLFLGILQAEAGHPEAGELLARSTAIARETGLQRVESLGLAMLARLARQGGRAEEARAACERAVALLERYGAELPDRVVILGTAALLAREAGERERAEELERGLRRLLRRENERIHQPLLRRRQRMASTRLLEAVLSPEGNVFPRVRLALEPGGGAD